MKETLPKQKVCQLDPGNPFFKKRELFHCVNFMGRIFFGASVHGQPETGGASASAAVLRTA
jgi:hypothetical protein